MFELEGLLKHLFGCVLWERRLKVNKYGSDHNLCTWGESSNVLVEIQGIECKADDSVMFGIFFFTTRYEKRKKKTSIKPVFFTDSIKKH